MEENQKSYTIPMVIITTLFFAWGFITVLNDILIPHFRNIFDLSYAESTLINSFFFAAYFAMSFPASFIIEKIGYQKGIVFGLTVTGLGAFLFYPAAAMLSYPFFLIAFFILAAGLTVLQVCANPYVTKLGSEKFASSRLNLAQAFNSLGTTLAGPIGSALILGGIVFFPFYNHGSDENIAVTPEQSTAITAEFSDSPTVKNVTVNSIAVDRNGGHWIATDQGTIYSKKYVTRFDESPTTIPANTVGVVTNPADSKAEVDFLSEETHFEFRKEEAHLVQLPYIIIGSMLFVLAAFFYFIKLPVIQVEKKAKKEGSLMQFPHLISGAGAIFAYVGAEVAIGSFLVIFFEMESVAGLTELQGGYYVGFYWGAAMIGRFLGALIMRYVAPNKVLAFAAAAALLLIGFTIVMDGPVVMWSIIAVGLFNSIMFPTIFSLSVKDLGEYTSRGSGLLIAMIVGGAAIPYLMGILADNIGVQNAFALTLVCYLYILFFAVKGYRMRKELK